LVDKLETFKIRRTLAVVIVFFGLTLSLILLIMLLGPMVKDQISALSTKLPSYLELLETKVLPKIAGALGMSSEGGFGWSEVYTEYGDKPILAFYLLRDWDVLVARIGALIPRRHQERAFLLAKESDQALGSFLRGQLMVMIGLSIIYTLGLVLIGLENSVAIGVLAGLVSFVPYLGFVVGIALAGLTAFAQGGGLLLLIGVVAVFGIGQMIEGTLLTPKLVGESIGLHPVVVIFAVMAGGQLFGFFGILLALPVAAVLSVFLRHFYADFIEDDYHVENDLEVNSPETKESDEQANSVSSNDDNAARSLSKHDPFDKDFLPDEQV